MGPAPGCPRRRSPGGDREEATVRVQRIALAGLLLAVPLGARALEVGDRAPPFEAQSTAGTIRLADYVGGKTVLLAFYLRDFTRG
jgi:hypothetical protein